MVRILAALVGRLPWRALGPAGALLGWIAGSLLRIRRVHVEESMLRAGLTDHGSLANAMYRALGRSALELLWLGSGSAKVGEHARIDPASLAAWREAIGSGRGVVVAASHTGNWDLAACAMAREVDLLVVTKRLRIESLDRFWQSTRAAYGVRLADAHGAMQSARATLRRGGAVAMMIDQVPSSASHAMVVEFLGQPALADRAPAALAAARGAPLVVAASRRDDRGEHVLHVLDVLLPPSNGRRAWIEKATVHATRALDRFVRIHPDQWLWMHRRWKCLDPGPRMATLSSPCTTRSSSPGAASRAVFSSAPESTRT
jgi:KDO2-lipid IV(A) lauroyltransferase